MDVKKLPALDASMPLYSTLIPSSSMVKKSLEICPLISGNEKSL